MMSFKNSQGLIIVRNMISCIQYNKNFLSEIDGKIGDGDHGINMNKGFTLCEECLNESDSFSDALGKLGNVLLTKIGGSMGPIYGMFFLAMQTVSASEKNIDVKIFYDMLQLAYNELTEIGEAKVGDKTIMDTLIPALQVYENAISDNKNFIEALKDMDLAAERGYKSTENLVAKLGRASRLGERSRGVLDPGATSCYLLLNSMKNTIITLLQGE